jgi:hypothetical protein
LSTVIANLPRRRDRLRVLVAQWGRPPDFRGGLLTTVAHEDTVPPLDGGGDDEDRRQLAWERMTARSSATTIWE